MPYRNAFPRLRSKYSDAKPAEPKLVITPKYGMKVAKPQDLWPGVKTMVMSDPDAYFIGDAKVKDEGGRYHYDDPRFEYELDDVEDGHGWVLVVLGLLAGLVIGVIALIGRLP